MKTTTTTLTKWWAHSDATEPKISFCDRIDRLEALLDTATVRSNPKLYAEIAESISRVAAEMKAYKGRIVLRAA